MLKQFTYATIALFSLLLPEQWISGQNSVKGVVYLDTNDNNRKDRREQGLPNVQVSNGREVVTTNEKGAYVLPVSQDDMIFVIKPSGYEFPVNTFNQPDFYYIHKPQGSPELKYDGVAPTGDLPESVNFALRSGSSSEDFKILVFGDPQPYNETEVDYFYKGIVSEIEGRRDVTFGLSLGDLVGDNLNLFSPYKNAIQKAGIPWFNVMGNHDENYDVKADSLSDETFEKEFGPATYSFNQGKVHFIILDDILYPDPRDGKGYWGGFTEKQLTFIKNDLAFVPKDHLIVLAFHIPILELEGNDSFRDEDRNELFALLKEYPNTLSLSAHTHFQGQFLIGQEQGWLQNKPHHHFNVGATCGDWYSGIPDQNGVPVATMRDGTPKGYVYLSFRGNQYSARYKVAGHPDDYQIAIHAPKIVAQNERTSAGIYANFFMGSPVDTIRVRIDQGEWKYMHLNYDYDPSYLNLLHQWDFSENLLQGSRPSNPDRCHHLWRSPIPTNLPEGEHTIEVKATDLYGQTYTGKSQYRIIKRE